MKQPEAIPTGEKDLSRLPRFLRGLIRGKTPASSGAVPPAADTQGDALEVATTIGRGDGHRPKILVVDDDPVVLKTLELKLSRAGFAVALGHDGTEAVKTARKEHPDVIVLDVNFPPEVSLAWDGIGVMKWLKRLDPVESTPIIIMTGMADGHIREQALGAGALAFFQKPIDNDRLVEVINKALEAKRGGEPVKPVDFTI